NGATTCTLYAQWSVNSYTLTLSKGTGITAVSASGTGVSNTSTTGVYNVNYGSVVTLSYTLKTGYSFSTWKVTAGGVTVSSNQYTHNTTNAVAITANATANDVNYKVTIKLQVRGTSGTTYDSTKIAAKTYTAKADSTVQLSNIQSLAAAYQVGVLGTNDRTLANGWTYVGNTYGDSTNVSSFTVKGDGTSNIVLTYDLTKFTIAYVLAGGTQGSNAITTYDILTESKLPAPTRVGYAFGGWKATTVAGNWVKDNLYPAKLADTTNKYVKGMYGNVTLTATWTANSYTMTFDANGGTVSTSTKTMRYGTTYTDLPTPTRAGYTFQGWYAQFNSNALNFGRDYMYTDKISVHISAYSSNWAGMGQGVTNGAARLISCTEGGGWNIESDSTGKYIQYTAYNAGVGYKSIASTVLWSDLAMGWHDFDLIFDGTYLHGYLDGVKIVTSPAFTGTKKIGYNPTNSIFVGAEAGASATSNVSSYFVGNIGSIIIQNTSTLIAGTTYNTWTAPAQNVTVYARWKANRVAVTLNKNDSSESNGSTAATISPVSSVYIKYDSKNIYATADETNTTTIKPVASRNGYSFNGWYTAKTGGTKLINADGTLASNWTIASATILYAQWTANSYTITLNGNGGSVTKITLGTSANLTETTTNSVLTATFDKTGKFTANVSRTGYTFRGWYNADGNAVTGVTNGTITGSNGAYSSSTTVSNLAFSGNVNLYANWEADYVQVTLNVNKGTGSTTPSVEHSTLYVKYGAKYSELVYDKANASTTKVGLINATRNGYSFAGWYT
ncbi:MAG: InlB B-repeat-containing protein, partial [Bacilli bacterium]|nr:InlB B-repeat-containing protein [Bacilli bacterium]